MKKTLLHCAIVFIIASCANRKLNKPFSYSNFETPPGTVQLRDNFYVDASEIRNLDYVEFMQWTKKIYSQESSEYHKIVPDTNVWLNPKLYNAPYKRYYLTHPAYRNFPLVGITNDQAQAFCKWRTDRVMEFILIKKGIFNPFERQSEETAFTIERYFEGYFGKPDSNIYLTYYPEYMLIDTATYVQISTIADSLNIEKLKHSWHKKKVLAFLQPRCNYEFTVETNDVTQPEPPYYKSIYKGYIFNLRGNVRELTADKNISFGGSYIDSHKTIMETNFYPNAETNSYTGFRCMCKYKKWEGK